MAKTIVVSGGGQFVVELGLFKTGQIVPITGALVDHSQTIGVEEINTWSEFSHIVTARDMSVLDATLRDLSMGGFPKMAVRVGCVVGETSIFLPWQTHIVHWFNAAPQGLDSQAGPAMKIETRDLLYSLERIQQTKSRKGKISDIAAAIAADHGIGALVEPTSGDGLWVQAFETDFELLTRLRTRAVNVAGRGNYRLFVKDDILHFHTPEFQADLSVADYAANAARLTLVDNSQRRAEHGAAGVDIVAVDPKTGKAKRFVSSGEGSVRLADISPNFSEELALKTVRHVSHNQEGEVEAQAQSAYEASRAGMFEIILETERALHLRVNDILNLGVTHSQNKVSSWSGLFSVVRSKFIVDRGAMTNMFTLQRGELAGAGVGIEVGQRINLEEVRSSNLTRASEDGAPPSSIVKVQSPG